VGNFLTGLKTVSFSRRAQLRGVGKISNGECLRGTQQRSVHLIYDVDERRHLVLSANQEDEPMSRRSRLGRFFIEGSKVKLKLEAKTDYYTIYCCMWCV
jgi:hypothetical protein